MTRVDLLGVGLAGLCLLVACHSRSEITPDNASPGKHQKMDASESVPQPSPLPPLDHKVDVFHSRLPIASDVAESAFAPFMGEPTVDGAYDIRDLAYYSTHHHDGIERIDTWTKAVQSGGGLIGEFRVQSAPFRHYTVSAEFRGEVETCMFVNTDADCRQVTAVFLPHPWPDWRELRRFNNAQAILAWNPFAEITGATPSDRDWRDGGTSLTCLLNEEICRHIDVLQLPGGDEITTDETLEHVRQLTQLRGLSLWSANITDDGLAHLLPLQRLLVLNLDGCRITDEGLRHVGKLRLLKSLSLNGTNITDEGLDHLSSLGDLIEIRVFATHVSGQKIDQLQAKMPKLRYVEYGAEGKEPLTIP